MSKCIRIPFGMITVATLPDEFRIGDKFRCTYSRIEGRTGQVFTVANKSDAEWLDLCDMFGDRFERIEEGKGKSFRLHR